MTRPPCTASFPVWFMYTANMRPVPFWATSASANSDSSYGKCELCFYNCKLARYAVFNTRLLFKNADEALGFVLRVEGKQDDPVNYGDHILWVGIFYETDPESEIKNNNCCVSMSEVIEEQ